MLTRVSLQLTGSRGRTAVVMSLTPPRARTAAKSRTNLITNSGKDYQTAWPIDTNFGTRVQIHMGMDIRQTNCHSRHKGHLGGFRGSTIQKSGEIRSLIWSWFHSLLQFVCDVQPSI